MNKDLQNHKRIIHDVTFNQFKCVFCYIDHAYEQSLKEHKSAKHDVKEATLKCELCEKIYATVRQLKIHIRRVQNDK